MAYDSGSVTGSASLFAGTPSEPGSTDGAPGAGAFRDPSGVAVSALAGGNLFGVDTGNDTIRTLAADGTAGTWAGLPPAPGAADGQGGAAGLRHPQGAAMDSSGNLYLADTGNHTIRSITPGGLVSTLAGQLGQVGYQDGPAGSARFSSPAGVAVAGGAGGVTVYVADTGNQVIRVIQGGQVTTLAGTAGTAGARDSSGAGARDATFNHPSGLALDGQGNLLVADRDNDTLRRIALADGTVTTLAGTPATAGSVDGPGGSGGGALFNAPAGVAVSLDGRIVYVADTGNHTLRVLQGGQVTTLAGTPGQPGSVDGTGPTQLNGPVAIALDRVGNLFVANAGSSTVCLVSPAPAGAVTTIIGSATQSGNAWPAQGQPAPISSSISEPGGLAVDLVTGNIFITIDDAVVLADFQS